MKIKTYYDQLKVAPDAPAEVISAAFKVLAKKYHPDINSNNPDCIQSMQLINKAKETLLDPFKRTKYDLWIKQQKSSLLDSDDVLKRAQVIALKHGIRTNNMKLKRGTYKINEQKGSSEPSTMIIKLEFDFSISNSLLSIDLKKRAK